MPLTSTSTPVRLGNIGLQGWRAKVADAVEGPATRHTPLNTEQVRAIIGATFVVLSVMYLVKSASEAARTLRDR